MCLCVWFMVVFVRFRSGDMCVCACVMCECGCLYVSNVFVCGLCVFTVDVGVNVYVGRGPVPPRGSFRLLYTHNTHTYMWARLLRQSFVCLSFSSSFRMYIHVQYNICL